MSLNVDHVTIAGSRLDPICDAFARQGLAPEYGGTHSNGVTHMASVGFGDGSYLELISTLTPGAAAPWWHDAIAGDAGPCAWAVAVDDVAADVERLRDRGLEVGDARRMNRTRPDGQVAEWDLAVVGGGEAGACLPFLIGDITPRAVRIGTSAPATAAPFAGAGAAIDGIGVVLLAVSDLPARTAEFRRAFDWPAPLLRIEPTLEAQVAWFPATPVALLSPLSTGSWLAERLIRFGDLPAGCLLRAEEPVAAGTGWGATRHDRWFGGPLMWWDPRDLAGMRLGIIGR